VPEVEPPRRRRERLLRTAALRDRMALAGDDTNLELVAAALLAAGHLTDHDGVTAEADPRGYVRQQYQQWTAHPAGARRGR
jgi:hypothetical protein